VDRIDSSPIYFVLDVLEIRRLLPEIYLVSHTKINRIRYLLRLRFVFNKRLHYGAYYHWIPM
jgi:hypothetical protein